MPSGKLGSAALAAATSTTVYTVPTATIATLNVSIVNRGFTTARVDVAVGTNASPADADYLEFGAEVPANGVLERTAIVASAAERVVARSSTANCTVRVHGFEESV